MINQVIDDKIKQEIIDKVIDESENLHLVIAFE
jgi:hypothetical protein